MKKYKLIKEYPGSPKIGAIAKSDKIDYVYYYLEKNSHTGIGTSIIENNPEFWEEVVEKDYEVLSYIKKDNSAITTKRENGFFLNSMFKDSHGVYSDYQLLNTWNIYSVKRLSDGEIFTIGDIVEEYGEIRTFLLQNDKIFINEKFMKISLPKLVKVKQPLFKTEDGVDIYEGDNTFGIDEKYQFLKFNGWVWKKMKAQTNYINIFQLKKKQKNTL